MSSKANVTDSVLSISPHTLASDFPLKHTALPLLRHVRLPFKFERYWHAIQLDGINHVPKTVDGFDIFVGQRYSVVLNANKAVKNYWIRAPMSLQHSSDNKNCKHIFAFFSFAYGFDIYHLSQWILRTSTPSCTTMAHQTLSPPPKQKMVSPTFWKSMS